MESFYIIQAIGLIASFLSLSAFQFKSQKTMFGIRIGADFLWIFHYFLLNAYEVMWGLIIANFRTLLSVFIIPQYRKTVIIVAIIAVWTMCVFSYEGSIYTFLPAIVTVVYSLSNYYHEKYMISRLLMCVGYVIWIIIGFVFSSYAEILNSFLALSSVVIGMYRHGKINRSRP